MKFDLPLNDYYLLLASGSALRPSTVDYHDIVRAASQKALRLSSVANVEGRSKVLLRLHGAFMITAWIGTASIGILLARYFKQTWVGGSMCGKDMWFAVSYLQLINLFTTYRKIMKFLVASNLYGSNMGSHNGCIHNYLA